MRKFYFKKFFLCLLLCVAASVLPNFTKAQTTLSAGDIIFTGFDSSPAIGSDKFSFVLLANISAGTVINFTDKGYFGSGWQAENNASETSISWTSATALPIGTEITITGLTASKGTVIGLGSSGTALSLSNVGDQIIAYQGGGINPASGTKIAGIHWSYCTLSPYTTTAGWDVGGCGMGPNFSALPPGLTGGTNAFWPGVSGNNIYTQGAFNGTGVPAGSVANIRSAVMNQANWTLSSAPTTSTTTLPTGFTYYGAAPTITGNPANRTVCANGATTFTVTAQQATSYQWQVNTGAGFNDIQAGAPYSGITGTTLTVSPVVASMSGYTYRCVVTGATGNATSNSATLTTNVVTGTAAVTQVSCYGGSNGAAAITVTSGIGPFSYAWSPRGGTGSVANGLTAGTYTCTITDNLTCQGTVTVVITEPTSALAATISASNNVSCPGGNNGSATVSASGGTPGYTYLWSNGATTPSISGILAGTYNVTVTDLKGCTTTASATIDQPAAFVTGYSTTPVNCSGGSNGTATVTVNSGGQAPFTYQWSAAAGSQTTQTATGLSAGTYTCTITDANLCSKTITGIAVTQPSVLVAVMSFTDVSCHGGSNGSATVSPSGGNGGYTYLWTNGYTGQTATNLVAGPISCTVTDAKGCAVTKNFTIGQPASLVASQGAINNVSCNGGSNGTATVLVTGGTAPYTYDWNGTPTGDGTATISGLAMGTYTVTVKDANLCQTTQSFTISQPAAFTVTTSQTDILCNGSATGAASVNVSGGTGAYSYLWSPSGGTQASATGLTAGTYTVAIKDANLCQTTRTFTITEPAALVATAGAQTNINCRNEANGSATVNVTGGTGAYTYSWSPSGGTQATASGLAAGTYTVTVKDANLCQTTQSFTITQPAAILSATTASTGVSCFGGSNGTATVNVSGGTPTYSYLWAPLGGTSASISGRPAGNYTCTITDSKGCTLVKNVTIATPAAFSATMSKTDVSCSGGTNGSATVVASGATAPYSYAWSPTGGTQATASGLAAGNYTVTITDVNTCSYTVSVTIGQPAALSVTSSKTDVLCNGSATGSATVNVSGGTPGYTYLWSPSGGTAATASGLNAGNYNCLVTDANGCTFTQNFTIGQPAVLSATTSQINATCTTGGQASVSVAGGAASYTYLWSPSGQTTQIATGLAPGAHSVLITDANGCTLSKNFTISTTNTLVAATSKTDVLCNGSNTGSVTVVPSGAPGPFTYVWAPSGGNAATASNLTAGNYSVTITSANGCSIVKNFTINEPAAFVVTPSQTNIACYGSATGTAGVVVSGGTGAYSYVWAPRGGTAATATGLSAGTYVVTVTDANLCQTTQSFTITEPSAITASTSQTNVTTALGSNGSATVTATGGTGAYSYVWSPTGGTAATATGLGSGNYTVTVTDANGCSLVKNVTIVEPASISSFAAISKVYGDASFNITAPVSNSPGAFSYTSSDPAVASVNGNTITVIKTGTTTITATQAASGNYAQTVATTTLSVNAKQLTINNIGRSKVYGQVLTGTDFSGTITGLENGDNISVNRTSTGAAATAAVGNYPIVATVVDPGNKLGNYTVTNPNGTLSVTAKALTIASTDRSKVYGQVLTGTDFSGTITGLENGDNISVNRTSTGAAATAAVGNYPIVATVVDPGNKIGNYTLVNPNGALTVTAKALTIAITDRSKVYGQVLTGTDFVGTITGLENGDNISVNRTSTGAAATAAVGNYPIVASIVDPGNKLGNYTVSNPNGVLTVTAKALTIASTDRSKVYGQVLTGTDFAGTITGLENGDNITVSRTSTGAAATAAVGNYPIVATLVDPGNKITNYTVSNPNGVLSVTAKALTIANTNRSKVYGQVLTGTDFAGTITGLENGDNITVSRTSTGAAATAAVGNYPIVATLVDPGNKITNYTVSNPNGVLSVTAKALTIANTNRSKVYGQVLTGTDFAGTITGLENGDNISVNRTSTGAGATAAVGNYPIVASIVDPGNKLGNYTLVNPNGTLSVTAKGLVLTADNKEKFAGTANPTLTVSYAGFVNNEDFNVLTTKPTIVTTAVLNSLPGDYPITASAAVGSNYSISYVAGNLKVKPGAPTDISLAAVTLYENAAAGANAGTLSSTSPDASATFTYTLVAGAGDTDNASFAISGNRINTTAVLDYETKAVYSVRVRTTTQYGLFLDKVISINLTDVNENPTLAAIANQTICYNRTVQNVALTGISAGPEASQTTTLSVSSNNANLFDRLTVTGTGATGTLSYQAKTGAAGTATVTVTVKDNGGTANGGVDTYSRTFVITINALPVLSINSDKGVEVSKGETVFLNATGAVGYTWSADNSIIGAVNAATLQVRPSQTTTYTVTGTNASGCSETKTFTITVLDDLAKIKATNILSPNGDGYNDKWIIENIDFYPNNQVKIFDRSGRLVFSKKGYDNSFDGTLNGLPLSEGTYYYAIDFGPGRQVFKGFITIVRQN